MYVPLCGLWQGGAWPVNIAKRVGGKGVYSRFLVVIWI